eukprot:Platyproteum_vivax@DN506_c0_g1_i1.p1
MEMSLFNVEDGYSESICRGLRSGFLTGEDYRKLEAADTLEDIRTALEDTDYGHFLQDEPAPLAVTTIQQKCREKLANEFRHMRAQASDKLGEFLDFVSAEAMIENVVNLIQGTINKKSPQDLLGRVDPLGWFPEMRTIPSVDVSGGYDEIYKTLLIDTPVGPYFEAFLAQVTPSDAEAHSISEVATIFTETDLELLKNLLKKTWMEEFYTFCESLGGTTFEVMSHVLKMEADYRVLAVTMNSLHTHLGQTQQLSDREMLYPCLGYLYPEGTDRIRKAWNESTIRAAIDCYQPYVELFEACKSFYDRATLEQPTSSTKFKSLEDLLYEKKVLIYELAFEQQFQFGIYYAWLKLKEQEIRNIIWIADMVLMKRKEHAGDIILIFKPRY